MEEQWLCAQMAVPVHSKLEILFNSLSAGSQAYTRLDTDGPGETYG